MSPWLSVVIPTAGQRHAGLLRTVDSIRQQPNGDQVEILVVADTHGLLERDQLDVVRADVVDTPRYCRWLEFDGGQHCYGQPQRSYGSRQAKGEWVAYSQDDNILAKHSIDAIWMALCSEPHQRPLFFKVEMYWGEAVWRVPQLQLSNIDADCLVLPRQVASVVNWGLRYEGDFDAAVEAMTVANGDVGWREETIAISRPESESIWW